MRLFFKHQDIENIKYFWKETIMENKSQITDISLDVVFFINMC